MDDSFAVVLPYYNERAYLRRTLESILSQNCLPDQLILVDNASTDGSAELCRQILRGCRQPSVLYLSEPKPGKIHALALASQHVRTPLVAFIDADTYYPPHYLELCARLFRQGGPRRVAVMAKDFSVDPRSAVGIWKRWFYSALSYVLYWQAFSGGCAQVFRTEAYRASGGYSARRWQYTLEDHEIMNRMRKLGRFCYHPQLWCLPAPRRCDRSGVSWTFAEQAVYHCTPPPLGDWFFNRFLATRFQRRRIHQANLRQRDWAPQIAEPVAEFAEAA